MVKDAIYFLVPLAAATVFAFWTGWFEAGGVLVGLAAFVAFFFRDPYRQIPSGAGIIVSPADGRVVRIQKEGETTRVSIFLSIFNVHVNRSPIEGAITKIRYRKGKYRAAFNDLASAENEQNLLIIQGDGIRIECTQIAGLVARRIVCWKKVGDTLGRGEKFGLIRFGSRTDLLLPTGVELQVQVGDRVSGGSSQIGVLRP
jgi:phosphatidylserine decarboxylase